MLKKISIVLIAVTCVIMVLPTSVHAKSDSRCKDKGCTRQAVSGPNRDGYCYKHSPKNKAVKCKASGCTNYAYHGSIYCNSHECCLTSCKSKKVSGTAFCSAHKSYQSKTTSSGKTKNDSSNKKKYEMPDCDDYEDYDDFMDDWDGCMPDGSDAEDYWEDW